MVDKFRPPHSNHYKLPLFLSAPSSLHSHFPLHTAQLYHNKGGLSLLATSLTLLPVINCDHFLFLQSFYVSIPPQCLSLHPLYHSTILSLCFAALPSLLFTCSLLLSMQSIRILLSYKLFLHYLLP